MLSTKENQKTKIVLWTKVKLKIDRLLPRKIWGRLLRTGCYRRRVKLGVRKLWWNLRQLKTMNLSLNKVWPINRNLLSINLKTSRKVSRPMTDSKPSLQWFHQLQPKIQRRKLKMCSKMTVMSHLLLHQMKIMLLFSRLRRSKTKLTARNQLKFRRKRLLRLLMVFLSLRTSWTWYCRDMEKEEWRWRVKRKNTLCCEISSMKGWC